MANKIDSPLLYPLAFGALVLSKGQSIAKSSLVPAVVDSHDELVLANSRLAIIAVARRHGRRADRGADPEDGRARRGCCASGVAGLRLRHGLRVRHPARQAGRAAARRVDEREALHAREHRHRGHRDGPAARRRRLLHVLRRVRAEALARAGVGVRCGAHRRARSATASARSSRRSLRKQVREEWMLAGALLVPALPLVFAARDYGRVSLVVRGARRSPRRPRAVGSRSTACCSATARSRCAAARSPASRRGSRSSGSPGGVLRGPLPRRRPRRDLRGRGRAVVRRPVVRRRVPPDGGREIRSRRRRHPARTSGCRSRSAPSDPDEVDDLLVADQRGFGGVPLRPGSSRSWAEGELDRTRVAFEARPHGRRVAHVLVRADDAGRRAAARPRPCRGCRCCRRTGGAACSRR